MTTRLAVKPGGLHRGGRHRKARAAAGRDGDPVARPRALGRRLSVRANFVWVTASAVLFQLCQWLMLASFARSAGSEAVGSFAFALAVTSPPILLANLNLRIVLSTDVRSEYPFSDYLALRICCLLAVVLFVAIVALTFCGSTAAALMIVAVVVAKAFDAVSDIIYGVLQKYETMNRIAVSRTAQGILQLVALVLAFHVTGDVLHATLAWAAMSAAITLTYDVRSVVFVVRRSPEEFQLAARSGLLPRLRRLFRASLPLAGTGVVGSLLSNSPIYLLKYWRSAAEVGLYSVQLRLVWVVGLAFTAFVQAATPRLAHYFADRNKRFWGVLRFMVFAAVANGSAGLAVAVVAGKPVLEAVYGPEYSDVRLLAILAFGAGMNLVSLSLGAAIFAARIFNVQFWIALVQFLVTLVASAMLIPFGGTSGAAVAFAAGICVYVALLVVVVARRLRQREWQVSRLPAALAGVPEPRNGVQRPDPSPDPNPGPGLAARPDRAAREGAERAT